MIVSDTAAGRSVGAPIRMHFPRPTSTVVCSIPKHHQDAGLMPDDCVSPADTEFMEPINSQKTHI